MLELIFITQCVTLIAVIAYSDKGVKLGEYVGEKHPDLGFKTKSGHGWEEVGPLVKQYQVLHSLLERSYLGSKKYLQEAIEEELKEIKAELSNMEFTIHYEVTTKPKKQCTKKK